MGDVLLQLDLSTSLSIACCCNCPRRSDNLFIRALRRRAGRVNMLEKKLCGFDAGALRKIDLESKTIVQMSEARIFYDRLSYWIDS